MSTISRITDNLAQVFLDPLKSRNDGANLAAQKQTTVDHLNHLFNEIKQLQTQYIELRDLERLSIDLKIFDPMKEERHCHQTDWNLFFQAMSPEKS